jgi:hypothetical protein
MLAGFRKIVFSALRILGCALRRFGAAAWV